MDIDEFLDRELSELVSNKQSPKHSEEGASDSEQALETSPLIESIKSSLVKGNIDEAEQAYVQLWNMLTEKKLNWDRDLYEQLSSLSRQFSFELNRAYHGLKNKSDYIYDLIRRGKAGIREGKKEVPFKLYNEIENASNGIPNVFFEEKRIIQEQVMAYYNELRSATDNDLLKRVSALIREIYQIVNKISNSIRSNDTVNATVNYNRCIQLYAQIPEGFLRHKNLIGEKILEIYKSLSIYNEITGLQKELHGKAQPQSQKQKTIPKIISRAANDDKAAKPDLRHALKPSMLVLKKENAWRNLKKGLYDEASRNAEEVLKMDPMDVEAKVIRAKVKTMQ